MADRFVSRGFFGRRRLPDGAQKSRLPPGQYLTRDFPVLSAGPTPHVALDRWSFTIEGLVREPVSWTWEQFGALPAREWTVDISCVTKWTKLDTQWTGVSVDTLLEHVEIDTAARFVIAYSVGGYTTNLPLTDVINGQAFVAYNYDGAPLEPTHGGPARLVVPHLYFWKSAKWVSGLRLTAEDEPGFWESLGYHNRGDPWREERYSGD
jgi:DMSO/TMAO reductase YedYZ molybdopterin-dependent catalytic subunit